MEKDISLHTVFQVHKSSEDFWVKAHNLRLRNGFPSDYQNLRNKVGSKELKHAKTKGSQN